MINAISNNFSNNLPLIKNTCKKVFLIALWIIPLSGAAIAIVGIVGYLPPLAAWIGGGVAGVSIPFIIILTLYVLRSKPKTKESEESVEDPPINKRVRQEKIEASSEETDATEETTESSSSEESSDEEKKVRRRQIQEETPDVPEENADLPEENTADPEMPVEPPQANNWLVIKTTRESSYQRIRDLVEAGKMEEAWQLYHSTCDHEKYGWTSPLKTLDQWLYLPPEKLIETMLKKWLSEEKDILSMVTADFIRDCATKYPTIRNMCLENEELFVCFMAYPEYVVDIVGADLSFGEQVMISSKGVKITSDVYRFDIFRLSYKNLISLIEERPLTKKEFKFLYKYLISYRIVISEKDYKRIQKITRAISRQRDLHEESSKEYQRCNLQIIWMNIVEGKLSLQGIYNNQKKATRFIPIACDLTNRKFVLEWIEEIARKVALATDKETVRKGFIYLSLFREGDPHYDDAQMMLGNIMMDVDNFSEAAAYYLGVAERKNEYSAEALQLAAACLLAAKKENDDWVFILREEMESLLENEEEEVRPLNIQESSSFTLELLKKTIQDLQKKKES